MNNLAILFCAGAAAVAVIAAGPPAALSPAKGGMWEVDDRIGGEPPRRLCVADPSLLANIEHRRRTCTRLLISEQGPTALFHYTCTGGGFARSQLTLITPRSIRIETQGISGGVPFHYVVQARRVGDC